MLTIVSDNLYWRVSPSIVSTTLDENFTFYSLTWITEKVWTKEDTNCGTKVLLEVFEEGDLKEDSR